MVGVVGAVSGVAETALEYAELPTPFTALIRTE